MKELFTFDDVLIVPRFSEVESRSDVTLISTIKDKHLFLPVLSANMDTITGPIMCQAMAWKGGMGVLPRFSSIEQNVQDFKNAIVDPMVSIGLGENELKRAEALREVGAKFFVIDVAHGAQQAVVNQLKALRAKLGPDAYIMVGNFASDESLKQFLDRSGMLMDAVKVGIGPGSACTTRIKTGVGVPQLSAIMQVAELLKNTPVHVVADGGMKTPGDIAKALVAGAHLVMIGGMLAGTNETPGEVVDGKKIYRGSASKESYAAQGKDTAWRTAEGESFVVGCKGPVKDVLADIDGGLRSTMTYVGAKNLEELRAKATFARVSSSTVRENGAHGKT